MGRKRYLKIVLPVLLIMIIVSVTSCFMFFMDWGGEGGLYDDWIHTNTDINETVFLTLSETTIEMIFDEDNPAGPYSTPTYFNDWGIKGFVAVDETNMTMSISISQLYRSYSKWYYNSVTSPVGYQSMTGGGGWYSYTTMANWPWASPFPNSNYWYNDFYSAFPGNNLGAGGGFLYVDYSLSGDTLTLTFPSGSVGSYTFKRQ